MDLEKNSILDQVLNHDHSQTIDVKQSNTPGDITITALPSPRVKSKIDEAMALAMESEKRGLEKSFDLVVKPGVS